MKRNLLILFATALSFSFVACQKKQYAFVQQGKVETFAHAEKAKPQATVEAQAAATENVVVASEEVASTAVVNPTETLTASNDLSSLNTTSPTQVETLKYNEQSINNEFDKLNKLEQYVTSHEGTTLADVKDTELTKDLNLDTNVTATVAAGDLPANIPAFWWGCVLSWVGVLIVYLVTDKDKDQTKKALYGCLVNAGVWILWYVVVVVALGRSFWF